MNKEALIVELDKAFSALLQILKNDEAEPDLIDIARYLHQDLVSVIVGKLPPEQVTE